MLVEGVSKRSRDQLFGRTEQNRVVVFDRGTHRVGDFVMVKVTESSSATLKGEEVVADGIRQSTISITLSGIKIKARASRPVLFHIIKL